MASEGTPNGNIYLEIMKKKIKDFFPEEGARISLSFIPQPSDMIVTTALKCGTTWMQQIVHQLRSGGGMDYEDISDVVPYIDLSHTCEVDLEAEQRYQPRCYKTHCWYHSCPKGGKYIVIYREPCAVFYSFFNFLQGWFFQPGQISLDEFVKDFLLVGEKPSLTNMTSSYFYHLISWWSHRNDPNVLFLFYEDMKEDIDSVIRAVASFMGIHDETRVKKARELSTFDFMKANSEKYKDLRVARYRNGACGLPLDHAPDRVATGTTTKALEVMSNDLKSAIQKKWEETVCEETGYKDYQELRRSFRKQNPLI